MSEKCLVILFLTADDGSRQLKDAILSETETDNTVTEMYMYRLCG